VENQQIAFLGGGHMARALIGGLIARGVDPANLHVGEPQSAARGALADLRVHATPDNAAAVGGAAVVVIAVKPQDVQSVVVPLRSVLEERRPVVLSIAAGIRVADLTRWCGAGVPVARAMPNRPALVGAGAAALYAPPGVNREQRALAARIIDAVGMSVWVEREEHLHIVTAVSGSGPAYFFLLAESLAATATRLGLDAAVARRLVIATLHGAGALASASDGDLARLREEVTSKGGTTAAALRVLAESGFVDGLGRAVESAARRSRELAQELGEPE